MARRKRYPVNPPAEIGEIYTKGCHHCGGSGEEPGLTDLTCRECFGRGRLKWRIYECRACKGNGRSVKFFGLTKCNVCRGQGWIMRDVG